MELKMINTRVVTVEELKDIQYLDLFTLTEKAYMDYIGTIKYGSNIDYNTAKKKIIRNILLSREAHENKIDKCKRLFYYGNLQIMLNEKEKTICFIKNTLNTDYNFKLDVEKRKTLNYIMGLKNN